MQPDPFWTSQDGQILAIKQKDERSLSITLAFWPRHPAEFDFLKPRLATLHFTERSTLARIGIEMITRGQPRVDGARLVMEADAFLFDASFPHAAYWKKLLRIGSPVGRLFYAPDQAKLSTQEIWNAVQTNLLKLPNTISIDRDGRVFLTPHRVLYTLSPRLQRPDFERLVSGDAGRAYLDKVQVRHDTAMLTIPPQSGVLTSCSMYLKEHFVLLNRGEGNFGIHTSAVLLDPIKTFGTNIMLEIYNSGDQPVVNPMVSVEIFRAPPRRIPGSRASRSAAPASFPPRRISTPASTPARPRPNPPPSPAPASALRARARNWRILACFSRPPASRPPRPPISRPAATAPSSRLCTPLPPTPTRCSSTASPISSSTSNSSPACPS